MVNNYKKFVITFLISTISLLFLGIFLVVIIDPCFHYRKPNLFFSHKLENERYINDGILKNFDYNGIIIGNSLVKNMFKTEADRIFGCNFIKVPFSGAAYKEICDNIKTGFLYNKNIKIVIWGLEYKWIFQSVDYMRFDLEEYPTYLYNDNIFDDVKYIFNVDMLKLCFDRLYKTLILDMHGFENNFDSYSYRMDDIIFGPKKILSEIEDLKVGFNQFIDDAKENIVDKKMIKENIEKNVISIAIEHPNVEFYCFIPPYSCVIWGLINQLNLVDEVIDVEKYVIEMLLPVKNIHLFSFNNFFEITTDLNNYKDAIHYGEWISIDILNYMKNNVGLLTKDNYLKYIYEERKFYKNFDYNSLYNQIDEPDRPLKLKQ